ncbi:MAG: hypothetical protein V4554_12375 [Pseudomonadota bacterium]
MTQGSRAGPLPPVRLVLIAGMTGLLAGVLGIRFAQDVQWVRFFDNLHWTAGTVTAAILAWIALHRVRPESARGARWIAVGLTGYAAGQMIWDLQVAVDYRDFPSPSDLFYLWLGPGVGAGLLFEAFRMANRVQRKTLMLDATMLAIAALTLVLVLYLPKRIRHG